MASGFVIEALVCFISNQSVTASARSGVHSP